MNVELIKERCVGNCAICTIHKNHPGFDYYSCVLNQIFQRTIMMEERIRDLDNKIENQNNLNQTIYKTEEYEQKSMDDVQEDNGTRQ